MVVKGEKERGNGGGGKRTLCPLIFTTQRFMTKGVNISAAIKMFQLKNVFYLYQTLAFTNYSIKKNHSGDSHSNRGTWRGKREKNEMFFFSFLHSLLMNQVKRASNYFQSY